MEAYEDDLRDKGYGVEAICSIIESERKSAQMKLYDDVYGKVDEQCVACLQRYSEYFTEENWRKMGTYERSDALNMLAVNAGDAFRTEVKGVKFFEGPPINRGYYSGDGYLYINNDVLSVSQNRLDAVDTVFHEGRHAFQERAVKDHISCSVDENTVKEWKGNFPPNYIRREQNLVRYFQQPIEADAFGFAEEIIKKGGI